MSTREFDVVVIGAGPAGEVCAGRLAETARASRWSSASWSAASARSTPACLPRRCCARPGARRGAARAGRGARRPRGELDVRRGAASPRRGRARPQRRRAAAVGAKSAGSTLVRGHGRLEGERARASGRRGSCCARGRARGDPRPRQRRRDAADPGLREARPWTNREATTADAVPAVAAGARRRGRRRRDGAGVRLAGRARDVVEALPAAHLAARRSSPPSRCAKRCEAGVEVCSASRRAAPRATGDGDGHARARGRPSLRRRGAAGRGRAPPAHRRIWAWRPSGWTPGADRGRRADARARARLAVSSLGDANGRALLTHMGKYQARIAADHILGRTAATTLRSDGRRSPRVIFTEPQVAAVGYTLRERAQTRAERARRRRPDRGQRRRQLRRAGRAGHVPAW